MSRTGVGIYKLHSALLKEVAGNPGSLFKRLSTLEVIDPEMMLSWGWLSTQPAVFPFHHLFIDKDLLFRSPVLMGSFFFLYRLHLWVHHDDKRYECDECGKTFIRHDHLTKHKKIHSGKLYCVLLLPALFWRTLSGKHGFLFVSTALFIA